MGNGPLSSRSGAPAGRGRGGEAGGRILRAALPDGSTLDVAVADMEVGDKKTVHIPAADAYGERRDDLVLQFQAAQVPDFDKVKVGDKLFLSGPAGQPVPVTVTAKDADGLTLDANHELAGKPLNFEIELVSVEE